MRRVLFSLVVLSGSVAASADLLPLVGCTLEPSRTLDVSSPVAGVIERFPLERGDAVRSGQLLFKLQDGVERASVSLADAKAEFARRKLERNSDLLAQDLLSDHERDEIETEHVIAVTELRAAQEQLKLRTITSPIDGVVVDKLAHVGEYVGVDPVVRLARLDPLHVELLMPSDWFGRLSPGQTLTVIPESSVGGSHPARVTVIDPVIDRGSGTFRVRLHLANPNAHLPAGVSCRVEGA